MLTETPLDIEVFKQANEWGRAIVQAYMGWYVFFVAGNIAMLAWIHTRRALKWTEDLVKAFKGLSFILWFLNLGGIISSSIILRYLNTLLQRDHPLVVVVFVAGIANTVAIAALFIAWTWVWLKQPYRKTGFK